MSVGIHYTEAFANYAEFAAKSVAEGKPKSVVRTASQYAPFATAKMGTAPSDGPGGFAALFRSGASKKANDIARDIFRQSVYDIFGGESLVPPSVREAMKLEDYGSGKPLTARRILAVKEAIDQEMMRFAETFEAAKATAPKALRQTDEKARAGELEILGEALRRCGLDRDAEAIVAKHADKFLLAPNESPRSAADVRAKVDRLLANLAELRAIAKGDVSVLGAGLELLDDLAGKDIPDGFLTKLARAAKSPKIGEIKGLSGASTPLDVHKAVVRFRDSVEEALDASGAKDVLEGAGDLDPCRQFLGELLILRCGESGARSVRTALGTVAASQALAVYVGIKEGKMIAPDVSSDNLKSEIRETATTLDRSLKLFRRSADVADRRKPTELHPYRTSRLGEAEFTSPEIVKDLTAMSERRIARDVQAAVDHIVKGRGPGSDTVRKLVLGKLGDRCLDPAAKLGDAQRRIVKNMLNWTLVSEAAKFARGRYEETCFHRDITRKLDVRIPGARLAGHFETAREQIARFVTRNPGATYATLDPAAKRKADLVMSILSQEGEKPAITGLSVALDPKESGDILQLTGTPRTDERTFELDITPQGDLTVRFTARRAGYTHLVDPATGQGVPINPKASISYSYELRIPAAELDRLAELAFSRYEDGPAKEAAKAAPTDRMGAAVRSIGSANPDFLFGEGVTCTASLTTEFPEEKSRK
jgi:hypothetical protein